MNAQHSMSSPTFRRSSALLLVLAVTLTASLVLFFTDYQRRMASAQTLLSAWKLEEAEQSLQSLIENYPSSIEIHRMYAECLLKRGELHKARNEYSALARLDSARVLQHTISLASTHFFLGNLDTASRLAETVIMHPDADTTSLAKALNLLGRIAFNKAHYDSALLLQRKSLVLACATGSPQLEADAMRQIGVLYWYKGKSDSARAEYYEPALLLYRRLNDKAGEATTLNNIGLVGGGMKYYLEAFAIRKKIGDQVGLADSYYFITSGGQSHWFDEMYSFREKSFELSKQIGYTWGEEVAARAVEDMAVMAYDSLRFDSRVVDSSMPARGEQTIQQMLRKSSEFARLRQWRAAADLRERVVTMCDSMRYSIGLEQALALQIVALIPLGEYKKAEAIARRLQKIWTNAPVEAGCFLARIYLASGRNKEAAQLIASLIRQLDTDYLAKLKQKDVGFPLISAYMLTFRYDLYSMLLTALKDKGSDEQIFDVLERFRLLPLGFGVESGNDHMAGGDESIWHRYVRTLEGIEKHPADMDQLMREFVDAYQLALDHTTKASNASQRLFEQNIPTMGDVQRALRDDQVFVEYFVGKEESFLLALRRDSRLVMQVAQPSMHLNSSARTLRELLMRGKTSPSDSLWKGPATFLFRSLIQPIIDHGFLTDGEHLIISPHGRLLEVPFACLLDSNRKLLVERFTVSFAPTASHILNPQRLSDQPTFLAIVPDRESLPFAEREVSSIPTNLFPAKALLFDRHATTREFIRQAEHFDVIHIAAHGSMNRWHPLFSHVQMSDGPCELYRILHLKLSSRLVVLSSCETGYGVGMMGDISQGHEVVSFPRAFLSAGAAAVISPLWIVEDEATSRLMSSFYSHLASSKLSDGSFPNATFAKALASAQREVVTEDAKNHSQSHPFYWAGFYLTGNPN